MPEPSLAAEVKRVIEIYEFAIGRSAARTWQMIEMHGEVEALSRLVVSADLQKGFKVLRDSSQLENTFEAVVVRFQNQFKNDAVEAAQWRLDNANIL